MSYFIDICLICLQNSTNLIPIRSRNKNGIIIEDKLKYILPKHKFDPNIQRYICVKCGNNLSYDDEFKQKCLKNITIYERYAQQITTTDSSCKYLSVIIRPDFLHDTNIRESQSEINIDIVKSEELELDDELESLLREMKDDHTYIKNENKIAENAHTSDDSVSFSNGNENISGQDKKEQYCMKLKSHIRKNGILLKKLQFNRTNKKPHTCKICQKSFRTLQHLKGHRLTHTADKKFTCEVCNKSFTRLSNLMRHKLIHTGEKPFTCEVCKKSYTRLSNLIIHKRVHSCEKPFTCEVCNISFKRLSNLMRHKLIHTGEKPFTCEVCNKSYTRLSFLMRHKLVHSGEKPFTCEVSNKSSKRLSRLINHKRVHSGEKPFTCKVYNKSFTQLAHLMTHNLMHTGEKPFTCEICNKSFRQMKTLKRHKLIHTG